MERQRLLALVAAFLGLALLAACGGDGSPEAGPAPPATASEPEPAVTEEEPAETTTEAEPARPKPLRGLPRYTAGYGEWTLLNAEPIPPREPDAHLSTKNVYASREARADGTYPYGTVIVKEGVRPGKDFVGLIAVMRKRRDADPANNDWVFVEWTREGADDRFGLQARDEVCWSCHAGAREADFVWIEQLGLTRR
ncbi:MAG TPA: cytochrome P460 family protein [Gaiellaceae bacterium]|nr:cytochrome P460 family protein [Gaiellaceae bacterium]